MWLNRRSGIALLLGRFVIRASGIVIALMLPRAWPTAQYGIFASILALVLLFESLAPFGTHHLLARELPRQLDAARGVVRRMTGSLLLGGAAALAGYLAFVGRIAVGPAAEPAWLVASTSAYLALRGPLYALNAVFQAQERGPVILTASGAEGLIRVLGVGACIVLDLGIVPVFVVFLVGRIVNVGLLAASRPFLAPRTPSTGTEPSLTGRGALLACLPLLGLDPLIEFDVHATQFLIGASLDPEVAAYFKVASSIATLAFIATYALGDSLMPRLSTVFGSRAVGLQREGVRAALTLQTMAAIPVAIGLAIGALTVPWVFGAAYTPAVPAVQVLALTVPIRAWAHTLGMIHLAGGRGGLWLGGLVLGAAVTLVAAFLTLPTLGVWGGVAAVASAQAVLFLFLLLALRRRLGPIGLADLFDVGQVLREMKLGTPTRPDARHAGPASSTPEA